MKGELTKGSRMAWWLKNGMYYKEKMGRPIKKMGNVLSLSGMEATEEHKTESKSKK